MLKIYSIYDSKAEAFQLPFFAPAHGAALRMFERACNEKESDFGRYPGDYTLFCMGEWDPQTGVLDPWDAHIRLGSGIEYVVSPTPKKLDPASMSSEEISAFLSKLADDGNEHWNKLNETNNDQDEDPIVIDKIEVKTVQNLAPKQ